MLDKFMMRSIDEMTSFILFIKVFVVKTSRGKEVAVVLMDTQGAFDSNRWGCRKGFYHRRSRMVNMWFVA